MVQQTRSTTTAPLSYTDVPTLSQGAKFCDTLDIDQDAHLLYAGDNWSAGVDIFDISTPKAAYLQTIRVRGNLYGVCVAKEVKKVYAGLVGSMVAVIDIDSGSPTYNTVLARLDTGGRGAADLVDFDPVHRKLYVANRNDGLVTVIDGESNAIVKRITGLGPGVEQPRYNPRDGMVYVTGNGDDTLYQIDPATDRLVQTFKIGHDCHPNGMAINPTNNLALLASGNRQQPRSIIWDLTKGAVVAVIDQTGGGDGAIYSAKVDKFFFAAPGFSSGPVIAIFAGKDGRFLTNVPVAAASSWVHLDETNDIVYAPAVREGRPSLVSFPLPKLADGF